MARPGTHNEEWTSAHRKLGTAHNEMGRFYLQSGCAAHAMDAFSDGIKAFDAASDCPNAALLRCNVVHILKLMATNGSSSAVTDTLTIQQRAQYESALSVSQKALDTLDALQRSSAHGRRHSGGGGHSGSKTDGGTGGTADASAAVATASARREVLRQAAMVCLIYGVRLGRACATASADDRGREHWAGAAAERKAADLLQRALRGYRELGDVGQHAAVHYQLGCAYRRQLERALDVAPFVAPRDPDDPSLPLRPDESGARCDNSSRALFEDIKKTKRNARTHPLV